ncbi:MULTISPECIES: hypothetical protein [Aeromonas]|uniref:hypothetical protein n=1 Tax=Aeromonas TaxID=642 RepID=UPI0013301CD8|nr:hypothetical protein [Aeromonas salmonicida]
MSKKILIAMTLSFNMSPSFAALTPIAEGASATNILFVENNVDTNVFVQPITNLSPRITGGNSWTSLKGTRQVSLGYGSLVGAWGIHRYNLDMWDDGPIRFPYITQRCILGYADCDNESHALNRPQVVDEKGFYGLMGAASGWTNAILSPSFYTYLRNMEVGSVLTRTVNACYTRVIYDALAGARCKDQANGYWRKGEQKHTKVGHLRLSPNNILSELTIDSNGTPVVLPGSHGCETARVNNIDGAICAFVNYELQYNSINLSSARINPKIKTSLLSTRISSSDLRFSVNKTSWTNYTSEMTLEALKGYNTIYLFLSPRLLKAMTELDISNISTRDLIDFSMRNTLAPESGYYEFGASAEIIIKPRMFSVSILSAEGTASPSREGKIGEDILSFPYNISDSGPSSANILNISVTQDSGSPYQGHCTFYPTGQTTAENAVPVPTRLRFNSTLYGLAYKHPIRCDSTPVNIRSLQIMDSQPPFEWTDPNGDTGLSRFYTLTLEFDLTDPMTQRTTTGDMWEGNAQQSGTITIRGIWL